MLIYQTTLLGPWSFEVYNERPTFSFIEVKQIHSNIITPYNSIQTADGITAPINQKLALAIKTADCMPIAIVGEASVALIHAGWRGLSAGILNHIGLKEINPLKAIIGPCISGDCYEVGLDVYNAFTNKEGFKSGDHPQKWFFDLKTEAKRQLLLNFPKLSVDFVPLCTMKDQRLHSYRRNQTFNRNWNILRS